MRTAESIEQAKAAAESSQPENRKRSRRTLPKAAEPYKFKPGQSGNPGGRPKGDVARLIARRIFEENTEEAVVALRAALLKGNGYVYKELADRGYGKVTDKLELTEIVPTDDADLDARIAQLERDLGLARQIDEAGGAVAVAPGARKANGAAKD